MNQERLMQVIVAPHVSEKSSRCADRDRQFVFKVLADANKNEIKKAVELMFEVEVDAVQLTNMKGKIKRFGSMQGRRSDWKKAYVRLKPGHDIDFMGSQ
jgi:large subunit ribosomal protein L23